MEGMHASTCRAFSFTALASTLMEECRHIPEHVDWTFSVSVSVCVSVLFWCLRACLQMCWQWKLQFCVFWLQDGTYGSVHCAALEIHEDFLPLQSRGL